VTKDIKKKACETLIIKVGEMIEEAKKPKGEIAQ
jgi:hypothetical protein